jgi:hypothetical protein
MIKMKNVLIKKYSACNIERMWNKTGPLIQIDLLYAISKGNISTKTKSSAVGQCNGWHEIDWKKAETKVKDLQEKIVIATLNNDLKEVYRLQWTILNCLEAKALAVRRVITNKGGKTAGNDKIVWSGPKDYWLAIKELTKIVNNPKEYKAKPLRRVYIPKGNTK